MKDRFREIGFSLFIIDYVTYPILMISFVEMLHYEGDGKKQDYKEERDNSF